MQLDLDFSSFVSGLDEEKGRRWQHGAAAAIDALRDITSSTWALAEALSEILWAGGDARMRNFWRAHLKEVLTWKVTQRLARLWPAFKNHPQRDMLGPYVWEFVNHDLAEDELSEVERMAKAGASPEDLRKKLDELGLAADQRRMERPYNEAAVKSTLRAWLEERGHKIEAEMILKNSRVCDLVTDEYVIEVKVALGLGTWDRAIGQLDSYYWCLPTRQRVLAFSSAAPELQFLMRQAIDNGYALLQVDCVRKTCEWLP
jgi:hypothetical protein